MANTNFADQDIQARLIAMNARGASADPAVMGMALSKLSPGVTQYGSVTGQTQGGQGLAPVQTQQQYLTGNNGQAENEAFLAAERQRAKDAADAAARGAGGARYNADGSLNTTGVAGAGAAGASSGSVVTSGQQAVGAGASAVSASGYSPTATLTQDEYMAKFGPKPVDEQAIRDEVTRRNQARIDAINGAYAEMTRGQLTTNEANLGSTRAVNARSGLMGSDFGVANDQNQRAANQRALNAIEDQRALAITDVYRKIDDSVKEEAAAKRAQAVGDANAYNDYLSKAQEEARKSAQALGASGLSLDELKASKPEAFAKLLKSSGYDEFTLAQVMNASKPSAQKIDYQYKTVGNTIVGYGINPATGKLETVEKTIEGQDNLQDYSPHTLADGTLVLTPKQIDPTKSLQEQVLMYGTEGQFAKEVAKDAPEGYKFVPATKYQAAGYFNPTTGDFKAAGAGSKVPVAPARGGGGGGSGSETKAQKEARLKAEALTSSRTAAAADIAAITGGDGYVDTAKFQQVREGLAVGQPELLSWFDSTYKAKEKLNPNDETAARYLPK